MRAITIATTALLAAGTLAAQQPRRVTLGDALRLALQN